MARGGDLSVGNHGVESHRGSELVLHVSCIDECVLVLIPYPEAIVLLGGSGDPLEL